MFTIITTLKKNKKISKKVLTKTTLNGIISM